MDGKEDVLVTASTGGSKGKENKTAITGGKEKESDNAIACSTCDSVTANVEDNMEKEKENGDEHSSRESVGIHDLMWDLCSNASPH